MQSGASTDLSPEVYYSYLRVPIKSMLAWMELLGPSESSWDNAMFTLAIKGTIIAGTSKVASCAVYLLSEAASLKVTHSAALSALTCWQRDRFPWNGSDDLLSSFVLPCWCYS